MRAPFCDPPPSSSLDPPRANSCAHQKAPCLRGGKVWNGKKESFFLYTVGKMTVVGITRKKALFFFFPFPPLAANHTSRSGEGAKKGSSPLWKSGKSVKNLFFLWQRRRKKRQKKFFEASSHTHTSSPVFRKQEICGREKMTVIF